MAQAVGVNTDTVSAMRETLDQTFRQVSSQEHAYTPSPKAMNSVVSPPAEFASMDPFWLRDDSNGDLGDKDPSPKGKPQKDKGVAKASQSIQRVVTELQERTTRQGLKGSEKVSRELTAEEIQKYDGIVDEEAKKLEQQGGKPLDRKTVVRLVTNQALNKAMQSRSQQLYQLATFDRVLQLVEQDPERFAEFDKDNKYKHYLKDDEGQNFKTPIDAINHLCERVEDELEHGSGDKKSFLPGPEQLISADTARDLGALLTMLGGDAKYEVRKEFKEHEQYPQKGKPEWDAFRNQGVNMLSNWWGQNESSDYTLVDPGDKGSTKFATSKFGPSLTIWHSVRFLEMLGASNEEQKAYVTAQVSDWASHDSSTPKENKAYTGVENTGKYAGIWEGAHTPFEGFMTYGHGVGLEQPISPEADDAAPSGKAKLEFSKEDKSTAPQTLVRLVLETRGQLYDPEVRPSGDDEVKEAHGPDSLLSPEERRLAFGDAGLGS